MRASDLLYDEQAETETAGGLGSRAGTPKRVEEHRQDRRGYRAAVVDLAGSPRPDLDHPAHGDSALRPTMLASVADEVRDDLEQAIGVPCPVELADGVTADRPLRERQLDLLDRLIAEVLRLVSPALPRCLRQRGRG